MMIMMRFLNALAIAVSIAAPASAQTTDWKSVEQEEGIPVRRYEPGPGRSVILARLKGSGSAKPLMLQHHMDVVPADRARWKRDPFGGEIAEGKI
jgi:acetylornithine deacetylase/succinyl-diaminopimelate desuccinylase-like protein